MALSEFFGYFWHFDRFWARFDPFFGLCRVILWLFCVMSGGFYDYSWGNSGVLLGSVRCHSGVISGSVCHHLGVSLVHLFLPFSVILR